ncbi:MAG: ABC transporter ATP-binding protein [Sphaerochaetaceae bacterium]|nr:ABC transporter ATP-binding protein [Sphaerochaetaceae bacterium]
MKKLFKYIIKQWKLYLISGTTLIVGVLVSALGPKYIKEIVDTCIVGKNYDAFWKLGIYMVIAYLGCGILNYIQEFSSDCISAAVQKDLRKDTYRAIMKQDQYFFRENNPGELMSRTKQDIENTGFVCGFISLFGIQIIFHVIYMTICLMRISFKAGLVALCIMPIIAFLAICSEPKGDKLSDQRSDEIANLNQSATETLSGIRTVKAFGREKEEEKRFDKHNRLFRHYSLKLDYLWANWTTPMDALARIMLVVAIMVSGIEVINGRMTLGEITAVSQYIGELSWPMMEIGWVLAEITTAKASSRKIFKIIDHEPEICSGNVKLEKQEGSLEFDNVTLFDGDKVVLENISFKLEPGKTLGIMGTTGSGKTTIANLAMRFIDPSSGKVLSDGHDLKELDLDSARKGKAIVTQDIFLFSDTINANLEKGMKGKLTQKEMIEASKAAAAHSFVSELSSGYETIIGEKGVGLSGGQKQRVAIARAFASKRPIIIFDDATSALDMETEKMVQKAVKSRKNSTMMIIAHRISAVRDADEIIILEKGRIVERGTHETLMAQRGLYFKTFCTQYPDEAMALEN